MRRLVGSPRRASLLIALAAMLVMLLIPATSPAADQVVARDSTKEIWALDGTVFYHGKHGWRRIVNGRVLAARRVPYSDWVSSIGRDRNGRIVMTLGTPPSFEFSGPEWVYDIAADRRRRVPGLAPRGCVLGALAFWSGRLAYESLCDSDQSATVSLRSGKRTLDIGVPSIESPAQSERLVLRGPTLAAIVDEPAISSDTSREGVWLLADASGACSTKVPGSFDWADENRDFVRRLGMVWLSDRYIMWSVYRPGPAGLRFAEVDAAKLRGGCRAPQPLGVPFTPPRTMQAVAIDGRYFYYATPSRIYRHLLPARL